MRWAIISDIHANLIGFEAFLDAVEWLHVDRVVCLGDIVGYNPWPNECVDIIREKSIVCVMGNHDRVAAGLEEPDNFNAMAREAILWTRGVLTGANRTFLERLTDRQAIEDLTILVHGSPRDPDEYILTTAIARDNRDFMLQQLGARLAFFGHTHVPGIFDGAHDEAPVREGKSYFASDSGCLINPGSIGQPRDGDPRSSFLVYDSRDMTVEFHRVAYDIQAVYDAIVTEGLPPHLGRRLFLGA